MDTVGDARSYESKLTGLFPSIKITVESKADSTYPIVSAASICAKVFAHTNTYLRSEAVQVTRDRIVRHWQVQETGIKISRQFGSGYPGDPTTKKWLRDHFDPIFGFPGMQDASIQGCKC